LQVIDSNKQQRYNDIVRDSRETGDNKGGRRGRGDDSALGDEEGGRETMQRQE
jgi:hypothetical protein